MGCVNAKPQHLPTSNPSSHTDGPTFDPTVSNQLLETIGEVGAAGNDNHSDQHSHTKRFSQDGVDANVSPKRHFGDETYVHNCRSSQGGQKLGSAEMAKRTDESGGDRPSGLFGYIFSGINDRRQRKSGGNLLLHSHFEGEQADNHVGNKLATTNEGNTCRNDISPF